MQKIADLNTQLAGRSITNASDAALADLRDHYIDQLSQLMDIRVVQNDQNQVSIFTNSGVQLVGAGAAQVVVQPARARCRRRTQWNADPTKSNLGTLSLVSAERHLDRLDRQQVDPLRQDRRLSRHARQRAGAGAEPARRSGRDDGAGDVEPDRRRQRRVVGAAERIRRRYRGPAQRQHHQSDLHRYHDQHPASASASSASTIRACCRSTTARRRIRTTR